ncbi:hypothetical protein SYNPS1DRAFT_31212 [Syncephalis pseudoplumigaleata]|uniref:Uncharacterized protein n=1 Tax=Syncephalis pseudoplumigaleata TaxID=1712513 RepID=A0A4P9YTN0_9FUNG|nr:hypothetical protein SYNPS1DRAFT_31212 [Syncephalis pseudoplumigaleata]|eukprot:RKP23088.1 hypothetical protein SYNPS1DRAFT_31212 [Syncephalis pseudoplumigaleata]
MPAIDYSNPAETTWMTNATHLWGIPLHPLGEVNMLDFYMAKENSEQTYRELSGARFQLASGMLMSYLTIRNIIICTQMVVARPRILASWCCLIPCFIGGITTVVFVLMELGYYFACRHLVWLIFFGISTANFFNSTVLLQKVYLILNRETRVLYASTLPMLLQLSYVAIMISSSFITFKPDVGCSIHYPYYTIWIWLAISLPLNIMFSVAFCYVAIKQYRQYGSDAWKRLARDGIQAMCSAALCNVICCILVATQAIGSKSDMVLATDWKCGFYCMKSSVVSSL